MYMLRIAAIGTDSWGSAAMLGMSCQVFLFMDLIGILASFVGIYKFLLNLFPIMFSVSSQPRKSIFSMPLSPGGLDVMDVQDLASGLTVPSIVDYTPSPVEDNLTVILADDIPPGHLSRAAEAHLEWVRRKTQRWQAVVAGGIAGGVAIMFEQKDRRPGIASQLLVRGLQGFWNAYSGMYGLTIPHGDVLVFCGRFVCLTSGKRRTHDDYLAALLSCTHTLWHLSVSILPTHTGFRICQTSHQNLSS